MFYFAIVEQEIRVVFKESLRVLVLVLFFEHVTLSQQFLVGCGYYVVLATTCNLVHIVLVQELRIEINLLSVVVELKTDEEDIVFCILDDLSVLTDGKLLGIPRVLLVID